jgi:hypothetical protein
MTINTFKCAECGEENELCEGDILQIYDEGLESLNCHCEYCEAYNEIIIVESAITIKNITEVKNEKD